MLKMTNNLLKNQYLYLTKIKALSQNPNQTISFLLSQKTTESNRQIALDFLWPNHIQFGLKAFSSISYQLPLSRFIGCYLNSSLVDE